MRAYTFTILLADFRVGTSQVRDGVPGLAYVVAFELCVTRSFVCAQRTVYCRLLVGKSGALDQRRRTLGGSWWAGSGLRVVLQPEMLAPRPDCDLEGVGRRMVEVTEEWSGLLRSRFMCVDAIKFRWMNLATSWACRAQSFVFRPVRQFHQWPETSRGRRTSRGRCSSKANSRNVGTQAERRDHCLSTD